MSPSAATALVACWCYYAVVVRSQSLGMEPVAVAIKSDDGAAAAAAAHLAAERPCDIYHRTGTPCAAARTCLSCPALP
jgi:hypothetical protein